MRVLRWNIKNHVLALIGGVTIFIIFVYAVVIPTVVARHYLSNMDARAAAVKTSLKNVSSDTSVNFFADPDVSLAERQKQIAEAEKNIRAARGAIADLDRSNKLTALPGNGFAGDYHKAIVRQERAANIVKQSSQVLDQYEALLRYLSAYTMLQIKLDAHLDEVNKIHNFNTLIGEGGGMASAASLIKTDQKLLASLAPPSDFSALQAEAVTTFDKAADSFGRLARALNQGSDPRIYAAVASLEELTIKNQVNDKNLLASLANDSPILRQVAELSEKVEHAQGR